MYGMYELQYFRLRMLRTLVIIICIYRYIDWVLGLSKFVWECTSVEKCGAENNSIWLAGKKCVWVHPDPRSLSRYPRAKSTKKRDNREKCSV